MNFYLAELMDVSNNSGNNCYNGFLLVVWLLVIYILILLLGTFEHYLVCCIASPECLYVSIMASFYPYDSFLAFKTAVSFKLLCMLSVDFGINSQK